MAHFVVSQIRLHKSKQKAFVVFCAEAIVPRIGEDGFKLVVKLKPHSDHVFQFSRISQKLQFAGTFHAEQQNLVSTENSV